MGRALAAVGGLLVLCFAILGVVIFATRDEDRVAVDSVLAEELTRAFAAVESTGDDLEIVRYTEFAWEEMLLVANGTPRAELDRALGFEFKGDLLHAAGSGDLFVFVADGALERFADYRGPGRFAGVERPIARFTPEQAVFEVRDFVARPKGG